MDEIVEVGVPRAAAEAVQRKLNPQEARNWLRWWKKNRLPNGRKNIMNHKIAILSDIYGNATALEAVIADAKIRVSEYWLGRYFSPGPAQMTWSLC